MTTQEERYLVRERADADVKEHGSVANAIKHLRAELEEMESMWGRFSSECLGHGIICTKLKIAWLSTNEIE